MSGLLKGTLLMLELNKFTPRILGQEVVRKNRPVRKKGCVPTKNRGIGELISLTVINNIAQRQILACSH